MSFALPPDFATTIASFLHGCGDQVVFTSFDEVTTLNLVGSVQRPSTGILTGDAIQDGFVVFIPGADFGAVVPVRFDRLTVNGEDRAIEEALPIEAGGIIHAWQLRVLG